MTKRGYKSKTGYFGTDAERYFSRLFMMFQNPNGHRRPDFVSHPGQFNPRLSIELKSGKERKGILVDYQLHYPKTCNQDFEELFGEIFDRGDKAVLPGMKKPLAEAGLSRDRVACYYDILSRDCGTSAKQSNKPFSSIKFVWGDHHIVPHDYGFYSFAISRHMRTGEPVEEIIDGLREMISQDVEAPKHGDYEVRKGSKQSWQSLYGRDVLAIFKNDFSISTEKGKERIELMYKHYKGLRDLKAVEIPGPLETRVYVLANPQDEDLFNVQMREIVESRVPILEKVAEERQDALPLLEKLKTVYNPALFEGEAVEQRANYLYGALSREEINKLNRLICWIDESEDFLHGDLPVKPDDGIPI